jgi:penicillin-binding protein 1C
MEAAAFASMRGIRVWWVPIVASLGGGLLLFTLCVFSSLRPLPDTLAPHATATKKRQVVDRNGETLSYTFSTGWNLSDLRPLFAMPILMQHAFIEAEDRRFYQHRGVDWRARLHALWQNTRSLRVVRGASTISEQVVRMLHPRPRTLWSRFLEGIEAVKLERAFTKQEILEFYLNQVPFAGNRRGVVQAARYFWDRDLETLSEREQLALAVMVRAPERLDLYKNVHGLDSRIAQLAEHMESIGRLTKEARTALTEQTYPLSRGSLPVRADHFVQYVHSSSGRAIEGKIVTTLNATVQQQVQRILEHRIHDLKDKGVSDGAVLVVDNHSGEVIAWVNAGEFGRTEGSQIDAVITPRQPGSTLKPLLYAQALSGDWHAATVINDAPIAEAVGSGLHTYRNYSRMYYGDISLREALGNSLNIPAIKTIHHVGRHEFLQFLHKAGFASLSQHPDFYGEGLALGNGEVTLFELVQAYSALANKGVLRRLQVVRMDEIGANPRRPSAPLITPEVASIIGNILSDPHARQREFGGDGLLRFPVQTAVKTGTSTDYRDAWALGFSERFTVGVWLGNLNRASMHEMSGARGPALVLRSIFAELHQSQDTQPLYLAPSLIHRIVCPHTGKRASTECPHVEEIFAPGSEPTEACTLQHRTRAPVVPTNNQQTHNTVRILMPTPGLNVARDPRIPDHLEALPFELHASVPVSEVRWIVDDHEIAVSESLPHRYLWPLTAGHHTVKARALSAESSALLETDPVDFWVR